MPAQRTAGHFRERLRAHRELRGVRGRKAGGAGLAACAAGWLNPHLIGLRNLSGWRGYIANMCTDVEYRGGLGRAALTPLLDWMRAAGIDVIDLHATPGGAPLYRSLGFTEPKAAAPSLRL